MRTTYAPLRVMSESNATQAEQLLHLGISVVGYDPSKNTIRLNVRPEADLANIRLIDSANLTDADDALQIGAEVAYFHGPLKINAEYVNARYQRSAHPDFNPDSWYVSGVYNLSGERFSYANGIYTVPLPEQTGGMWQLAARYSKLNANDGGVVGGEQDNFTLGVNWYWRLNYKFMVNYNITNSARGSIQNDPNVVELRAQIML